MTTKGRYELRRLDSRELGLPVDPLLPPSAQAQAMGFQLKLSPEPKPTRDDPLTDPTVIEHLRNAILLTRLTRRTMLPAILTGVMLIAWLAVELLGPRTIGGELHPATLLLGGAKANALLLHEPWRIFAAILLHAGAAHFMVNAVGTWFLSQMAENVMGWARTVIIFIAGGAISFCASALASTAPSVGASGSIYALLGGLMAAAFLNRRHLPKAPLSWLAGFCALWIVLSVLFAMTTHMTDNAAHAGGFIAGVAITMAIGRRLPLFEPEPGPTPNAILAVALICIVTMAAAFALSIRGVTLLADLPDPALREESLPGLRLPLPSNWAYGRLSDHKCNVDPDQTPASLAADGPLCAIDPYGSVLVLGRATDVVPGVILDSSMMAENGLRVFMGGPEGDVTRRWLVLDRRWTLAFNCYAILANKYDGMLSRILGGMRLSSGASESIPADASRTEAKPGGVKAAQPPGT